MREMPVQPPKSWLMTGLFGLIHVTKAKTLRNLATVEVVSFSRSEESEEWYIKRLTITRKPIPNK